MNNVLRFGIVYFQVVRMLAVIVFVFVSTWMPYRTLVVYNSMAKDKYMDLWFLLFCRTMVYINSAINPILYNAMSVKFRRAFKRILFCGRYNFPIVVLTFHFYMQLEKLFWHNRLFTRIITYEL